MAARGQAVHAAGTLSVDRWNGNERVQFAASMLPRSRCRLLTIVALHDAALTSRTARFANPARG